MKEIIKIDKRTQKKEEIIIESIVQWLGFEIAAFKDEVNTSKAFESWQ